jgi:excinuclease UvrABC nuclease subunit
MIVSQFGAFRGLSGYSGVYVIKDNARVLYVGQSRDIGRRLQQHRRAASSFGQAYRANPLAANLWRVTLLTVDECSKITGKPCRDLDDAEKAMIQELSPDYNATFNGQPRKPCTNEVVMADNIHTAILAIGRSRFFPIKEM